MTYADASRTLEPIEAVPFLTSKNSAYDAKLGACPNFGIRKLTFAIHVSTSCSLFEGMRFLRANSANASVAPCQGSSAVTGSSVGGVAMPYVE